MGGFAAVLSGMGQVAEQENQRNFALQQQQRQAMIDTLKGLADDLQGTEFGTEALHMVLDAQMRDPSKPLHKDKQWMEKYTNLFTAADQFKRSGVREQQAEEIRRAQAALASLPTGPTQNPPTSGVRVGPGAGVELPNLANIPGVSTPLDISGIKTQLPQLPPLPGREPAAPAGPPLSPVTRAYRQVAELEAEREDASYRRRLQTQSDIQQQADIGKLQARKGFFETLEGWSDLPTRDQLGIIGSYSFPNSAAAIKFLPGTISGRDTPPGSIDVHGNPVRRTATDTYRQVADREGNISFYPVREGVKPSGWVRDPESSTGYTQVYRDAVGNIAGIQRDLEPPSYLKPQITTSERFTTLGDKIIAVPVTTRTAPEESKPSTILTPPPGKKEPASAGAASQTAASADAQTIPGARVVGRSVVPVTVRQNVSELGNTKHALRQLFNVAGTLIVDEGPMARIRGVTQRGAAAIGMNAPMKVLETRRNALRSRLARTVGADVGNLAAWEQEWAMQNSPAPGMTVTEMLANHALVMDLLNRREFASKHWIDTGETVDDVQITNLMLGDWKDRMRRAQPGDVVRGPKGLYVFRGRGQDPYLVPDTLDFKQPANPITQ